MAYTDAERARDLAQYQLLLDQQSGPVTTRGQRRAESVAGVGLLAGSLVTGNPNLLVAGILTRFQAGSTRAQEVTQLPLPPVPSRR